MATIEITVLAFGSAVDALGWETRAFTLPAGATLGELIDRLAAGSARVAAARNVLKFAVQEEYALPPRVLRDGDEVAVIPPVSGGAATIVRLVRTPIDAGALAAEIAFAGAGALATFVGVVRAEQSADGRVLTALEYSGYEPMAEREMRRLAEASVERVPEQRVAVVHRLGRLAIGEASVAVVVAGPHRGAALDECRRLIDELKEHVPIFKQEVWSAGPATWVRSV